MAVVPFCHTARVMSIGERFRAARKRKGLSQPSVAAEAHCSLATYKRYETIEETEPPEGYQYLWRIAEILGVDLATRRIADDPDNPRLRDASELQLAQELTRRLADRAAGETAARPSEAGADGAERPIEVRGMRWDAEGDADEIPSG